MLGALVPWKRADLALEIAARAPRAASSSSPARRSPATATASRARCASARRAPDLAGRVTFAGALADPRPALARAHVLLHCADAEPFGMALLEALASGRPVAAPAAAGPLEIVSDGAGRLYAPGDADDGARAVRALLGDPAAPAPPRAPAPSASPSRPPPPASRAAVEAIAR